MMSSVITSALSKDSYTAIQSSIVIRIKTLKNDLEEIHHSIKIQFGIIAFINCLLKKKHESIEFTQLNRNKKTY